MMILQAHLTLLLFEEPIYLFANNLDINWIFNLTQEYKF